jgi:hypothetical protein
MAESLVPAMKGEPSHWDVGGSVDIDVLGFLHASVNLDNAMPLPSLKLDEVNAFNLEPRSGDGSTGEFVSDVQMSFFSTSIMEVSGIGDVTLDYYSLNGVTAGSSDATAARHKVGVVNIPNFGISRGMNRYNATFVGTLYRDPTDPKYNYDTVARIFELYSNQQLNAGLVVGPISNSKNASYLLNVLTQTFAMSGAPTALFPAALMDTASAVQGYNPINGEPCAVLSEGGDLKHCLRG